MSLPNLPPPDDTFHVPASATAAALGFRTGDRGTHTSRTIMLAELRAVLASCRPDASRDNYLTAIHEDNCLSKRTMATRRSVAIEVMRLRQKAC